MSVMWLYVFRVTIMKDKDTRKSKGVAFILFLDKESAQNCSRALNNKQVSYGKLLWWKGRVCTSKNLLFSHICCSCLEE